MRKFLAVALLALMVTVLAGSSVVSAAGRPTLRPMGGHLPEER